MRWLYMDIMWFNTKLTYMCCCMQGYFIQCLSTKLGVATGMHLAEHCRCDPTFTVGGTEAC